jgi:flagellar hook-associated protein 1 FlgK
MDQLLDREIRRQMPEYGQVTQELTTLQTLENLIGDLTTEGLAGAMNKFFGSLQELAAQPESPALREAALWDADALAAQFRNFSETLASLEEQTFLEARNVADQINALMTEVADLNQQIQDLTVRGSRDNNLLDRRDQVLAEASELAQVQVTPADNGSCTVQVWGTVVVVRNTVSRIEVDLVSGGQIGFSVEGADFFDTTARGGRLGALLGLRNEVLPEVHDQVDTLAREIMSRINRCHVQGIGAAGSFTELASRMLPGGALSTWPTPVSAGDLHLRVTDTATGEVSRHTITIDPSAQTAADVAALLDAVPHLAANIAASVLRLEADPGYTFDFLPALATVPATSTLSGTASPTLSGVYTGAVNQVFTATVVGTGEVGVAADLAIEVRNGAGELVRTLNVGQGYAAGDPVELADGIYVSFAPGTLNDGETFTVEALADSDPTGFLAAAGLNVLFTGDSARTMRVADEVRSSSSRLATSLTPDALDNLNVRRMAVVGDQAVESLGGVTVGDAYRRLVSNIGQWVSIRNARQQGIQNVIQRLSSQREDTSGVDINEQAAQLLMFERMFQAMAKFLAAVQQVREFLLEVV